MTATDQQIRTGTDRVATHEHAWVVRSRHRTTGGDVVYVRCSACAAQRVDIQTRPDTPPSALSRVVGDRAAATTELANATFLDL